MWIWCNDKKITDFGASSATANLDQKEVKAKLIFFGFLIEHELPLTTANHAAKLFRNMFPDSKIVNKYRCGRTKTTQMLAKAVLTLKRLGRGVNLTPPPPVVFQKMYLLRRW